MEKRALVSTEVLRWTPAGRLVVFILSAMSIGALLAKFYGLCDMRTSTLLFVIPSLLGLVAMYLYDRMFGDRRLAGNVVIGAVGGLLAAGAYDLLRLPLVVAAVDQIGPTWLRLPLFKVFPQFGAMILGQPSLPGQAEGQYTLLAHLVGWAYHFSNGMTFGVMYLALIGNARQRSMLWAVALAVVLEVGMLLTPYTHFFGIKLTGRFIIATLTAHLVFGITLGLYSRYASKTWLHGDADEPFDEQASGR